MKYIFKEVDYRYWFAHQILFSLLDFCSFDEHLAEECRNLAFYCDKFCGIPGSLSNVDLIETKAYYKLRVNVD